jgi:Legionella pneumophila major outer membrane protein precursor
MKKIILNLLGVFLCGLTTQAAAECCSQNYNDCCEWSVLDGKMTFGADWLYWKVRQDGILPGRIFANEIIDGEAFTRTRGIHPDPKWNNGFKVYLGYELPCECWDVNVCYTYIPSRDRLVNFTGLENELFVSPTGSFNFFASKWNLTLNNIDLDIGRTVCFGECLKIRPHVGFRATWFDQKFRSFGAAAVFGEDALTQTSVFFDALSTKQRFQGYGAEAGLWADYKLSCGLSLIGHFGGSILYSKFNVRDREAFGFINQTTPITSEIVNAELNIINATIGRDSLFSATPSLDYFIGLQYADTLVDILYKVHVGWEQHVLFDTNRFLSAGNLSGQGLTLGLEVGF